MSIIADAAGVHGTYYATAFPWELVIQLSVLALLIIGAIIYAYRTGWRDL